MCATNTCKIYLALLKCFYIVNRSLIYLSLYIMHSLTPPITLFILPTRFKVFPAGYQPVFTYYFCYFSIFHYHFTNISFSSFSSLYFPICHCFPGYLQPYNLIYCYIYIYFRKAYSAAWRVYTAQT